LVVTRWYAEFPDPGAVVRAIPALRALGPTRIEAYSPYQSPEIARALAEPPSRLSVQVLGAGIAAAVGAYALQWLLNSYLYPVNVGGRPTHFPLSFVPITFEMGVLFASFTAFGAVLVLGKMLRLWYRVFDVDGFESATESKFWLEIEPPPDTDEERLTSVLNQTGATAIRRLEDQP
jgi:hypothetical protein